MLTTEQKYEKKRYIAKSTCELFVQKGYVNITISEIAKVAGVGKGTIYEYFKSKEEIIFELMGCLQEDYDKKHLKKLKSLTSPKEKLLCLFDIYFSEEKTIKIQRDIYREYLSVLMSRSSQEIYQYHHQMQAKYIKIVENIFSDAIEKDELQKLSKEFIPSIFATLDGFFIARKPKNIIYRISNSFS